MGAGNFFGGIGTQADSEGNSIRWRVNLGYHISKNVDLGVSCRGMILDVDQDRFTSLVIPNNKTEMQGLLFRATIRFCPLPAQNRYPIFAVFREVYLHASPLYPFLRLRVSPPADISP